MRKLVQGTCLFAAIAVIGYCQTFEVASIRESQSTGERRGGPKIETTPGNLTMRNAGMGEMIMWAYKISPFQITNAPDMGAGRFEVIAKAAGPATNDQMRVMLQALLAERFKMVTHRETKELSGYALVEAKGGHKMKESSASDGQGVMPVQQPGKMALTGQNATLDQLAFFLSGPLRTVVLDKTGLKGRYDFEFDLTNFVGPGPAVAAPGEPPPDPVAILQLALPKQLGLKLEARKMPVEMLVIDHMERAPVEN